MAAIAGLGGDRTFRELCWAARERRRFDGELAAWHVAEIVARMPFGAVRLNPSEINPYRVVMPKSAKRIELENWQARARARIAQGLPVLPLGQEERSDGEVH